ncbi:hypothetical protein LX36DRAFT_663026 [Colletotrichum falcatum]|nr:hypothetical protein LX36DRAFT_663026 [Colletotrichum falcatum]
MPPVPRDDHPRKRLQQRSCCCIGASLVRFAFFTFSLFVSATPQHGRIASLRVCVRVCVCVSLAPSLSAPPSSCQVLACSRRQPQVRPSPFFVVSTTSKGSILSHVSLCDGCR